VLAAAALAGLAPRRLAAADPLAAARAHRATLAAYVDVLLPDDGVTPAASALGVHDEILTLAGEAENLARLIAVVGDWMDGTGRGPFAQLGADADRLVAHMAAAGPDTLEGRFHQLIRLLAIEFYYARPEALAGLDLAAAPQPAGYPPPWD
jgi:hypothetical protein